MASAIRRPGSRDGTITIVAERDGEVVGFIHSVIDDDPKWGTLLDNLHVRNDVQGGGIARRLIGETAALLRERGRQCVYLRVLQVNERARRLYDALDGQAVETSVWNWVGATVPDFRYAWADLDPLLACLPENREPLKR
jgi:ribosomal protein S18 acetylase RimI-like enzyme